MLSLDDSGKNRPRMKGARLIYIGDDNPTWKARSGTKRLHSYQLLYQHRETGILWEDYLAAKGLPSEAYWAEDRAKQNREHDKPWIRVDRPTDPKTPEADSDAPVTNERSEINAMIDELRRLIALQNNVPPTAVDISFRIQA